MCSFRLALFNEAQSELEACLEISKNNPAMSMHGLSVH